MTRWYDDEAVVRAAGEACQMARFHGCTIEVHIRRRLGRSLDVVVAPVLEQVAVDGEPVTAIMPPSKQEGT